MQINCIVLAAGQGKRMKSKRYKVLHPVCGKPMLAHVIDAVKQAGSERTVVVISSGADEVREQIGNDVAYAVQAEQLGTGHAVMQAKEQLQDEEGITIVAYGDTPLITAESLCNMIEVHRSQQAAATLLTAKFDEPGSLGRIIRDASGHINGIVEARDCTVEQRDIKEINAGTYCFDNRKLFAALSQVTNDNVQNEYYLTDVISIMEAAGEVIVGYCTEDPIEAFGVNDRVALSEANEWMRKRINRQHMLNGVSMIDADSVYIEAGVTIGMDTVIEPGTILRGQTHIGEACVIGPYAELTDTTVGDRVTVKQSVASEANIGSDCSVGPYAYLRPGAVLGEHVKVGDFVEIKNATLGHGTKVSHLSYVGDATIGSNVNVGCGSITVNYDGYNKHKTEVGDDAFIGSNVNLVAPVKVGKGAIVAAGSTITKEVLDEDLAIARQHQVNKTGYAAAIRLRAKQKQQK